MGTWSIKPFGNDLALDWLYRLEASSDPGALIRQALDSVCTNQDPEKWESEAAIAAAAIIASAAFEPIQHLHKRAKDWAILHGFVPSPELIDQASAALERIVARSALKELWEENGAPKSWLNDTQSILVRLKSAHLGNLPQRSPKARGVPRALCKLLECYDVQHDPRLRAQIRRKFEALQDVEAPTRDTGFLTPLCLAAKYGLADEVQLLVEKGANPNQEWPIITACNNGHIEVAEYLLSHGAELYLELMLDPRTGRPLDKNATSQGKAFSVHRFMPGLTAAAQHGTAASIDFFLRHGGSVYHRSPDGSTLLHYASQAGNVTTIKHLIALGVDMNAGKHDTNQRPLHRAVHSRKLEAVQALLEAGADVNAIESWRGQEHHWDSTPLDIADENSLPQIAVLLKQFGAKRGADVLLERAESTREAPA